MRARTTVEVRIGEYVASGNSGITLQTSSLGSCVAVALYDGEVRVAGLCHVLLDRQERFGAAAPVPVGHCADSAIPALVQAMEELGAVQGRLVACLAGGGNMFGSIPNPVFDVGTWNIQAAHHALQRLGVPVRTEDVGGFVSRRLRIDVGTGDFSIWRLAGGNGP